MGLQSITPYLDIAETISTAALTITKSLLRQNQGSLSAQDAKPQIATNGVNGVNNNVTGPYVPGPSAVPRELITAKQALIQAASDLLILSMGPDNYLKSFSYGVCKHLPE